MASLLERASETDVDEQSIAWEPSPGFLEETFLGRSVLFLANKPGEPRDVYRAWVRVTRDGKPISVHRVRNLTNTPRGDEVALQTRDTLAAFASVALGRIQGISLLETSGIREEDRSGTWFSQALSAVTQLQETGSFSGLGRTDIMIDAPATTAEVTLGEKSLGVDFGQEERALVYDYASRTLLGASGKSAYAARAIPRLERAKPFVFWAVDTVRAEVGPEPIAWLENRVFGMRDSFRRTMYGLFGDRASARLRTASDPPPLLDTSELETEDAWPPPPVPSLWTEPKAGEGEWRPVTDPFLPRLPGVPGALKPDPYFYTTFIRPDPKRPYSKVLLIAMDMRQLELRMHAGYEDPKPTTGPPGDGRLPRDPAIYRRVAATFNGAFKTTHGEYGMMVSGRVLIPPVKGAASIIVNREGDTGLGSWPQTDEIPPDVVSFRQNLDPLLEDGITNPTGRYIWGWQLEGKGVMTQRTALCVTPAGHLYYAFAEEADGPTLSKALRQAGCSYGIHLDMNPGHCGFVFSNIEDLEQQRYSLRLAHPDMQMSPDRYIRYSPKDFFYVLVRETRPQTEAKVQWKVDAGAQPPPAWMPGIFSGTTKVGNLKVSVVRFEAGRVDFRIRAGSNEPTLAGAALKKLELSGDDRHRVLASIGLGHTTSATRYGLGFAGRSALPLRDDLATLVTNPGAPLRVALPGEELTLLPNDDFAQLPILARDGKLTASALAPRGMRLRAAFCVDDSNNAYIVRARHDSYGPLAEALLRLGCDHVLELDRGSQHPSFLHRAGTPTPPVGTYETSVLYALGTPMRPRAFRWKHEQAIPSRKPTGYDIPQERARAVAENEKE